MSPAQASGPEVRDSGQLLQLIALGRTVAVLPESVLRLLRSDLVGVPVRDAPSTIVVAAWPEQSRSLAVAAFVRAAATVAGRHDCARPAGATPFCERIDAVTFGLFGRGDRLKGR